jgi:membrane-associated phospholipid phosphatase
LGHAHERLTIRHSEEMTNIMAQHHDISHDRYEAEPLGGRRYALARVLSQVFHPILVNIASFLIVGYASLSSHVDGLRWAGICILTLVLPPTIFYSIRLRQGAYADEDVSVREQRNELYLFGFIWVSIATILLRVFAVPDPFLALMFCALALGLIGGVVNLFWKISAHSTAIASAATIGLLYSPPLGIVLWVCALLVGWARVRTRNHTPLQVLAGFCSATVVVLVIFQVFGSKG